MLIANIVSLISGGLLISISRTMYKGKSKNWPIFLGLGIILVIIGLVLMSMKGWT